MSNTLKPGEVQSEAQPPPRDVDWAVMVSLYPDAFSDEERSAASALIAALDEPPTSLRALREVRAAQRDLYTSPQATSGLGERARTHILTEASRFARARRAQLEEARQSTRWSARLERWIGQPSIGRGLTWAMILGFALIGVWKYQLDAERPDLESAPLPEAQSLAKGDALGDQKAEKLKSEVTPPSDVVPLAEPVAEPIPEAIADEPIQVNAIREGMGSRDASVKERAEKPKAKKRSARRARARRAGAELSEKSKRRSTKKRRAKRRRARDEIKKKRRSRRKSKPKPRRPTSATAREEFAMETESAQADLEIRSRGVKARKRGRQRRPNRRAERSQYAPPPPPVDQEPSPEPSAVVESAARPSASTSSSFAPSPPSPVESAPARRVASSPRSARADRSTSTITADDLSGEAKESEEIGAYATRSGSAQRALSGSGGSAIPESPAPRDLPKLIRRVDVKRCVRAHQPPASSDPISVRVELISSGEVVTARVTTPPYQETSFATCIERAISRQRVRPFRRPRASFNLPLRLPEN